MFWWKFLLWTAIFYAVIWIISKIFDKRKVKKYGRDITINGPIRDDITDDDGNGSAESDKQ